MEGKKKPYSLLRWAGSKRQLLPTLASYWNGDFKRYIEPFAGSAQFFFFLDADCDYVLSDKNHDLISTYKQVKKSPNEVHKILKGLKNTSQEYYRIRDISPNTLGKNQKAARFIYLNWLCYNGLYRTNNNGYFNVPYCGNLKKSVDNWDLIKVVSKKLENVEIIAGDFEEIVKSNLVANSLVYLDPPYAVENTRIFTQYGADVFRETDFKRLSELLDHIDKSNSKFILSYMDTSIVQSLRKKWNIKEVEVQRNISGVLKHRRKAKEIIVTNINS